MFFHPEAGGSRLRHRAALIAAAALMLAAAWAVTLLSTSSASGSPTASAAAKRCGAGKVLVRRPGRSSVCAKRCPAGSKRKVSRRGKVSCVKRKSAPSSPGPTAGPAPGAGNAPANNGPAAGKYSGETEQSRPVTFTVEGNEVKDFEAGVNTYCTTMYNQRTVFDSIANVPPMAIGPDGSFSYDGDENNGNVKIRGQVTGNTATGTVGMNRGDTNYSGGQLYFGSCSASDIKWSAAAG